MKITVAICTWNRAELLRKTLINFLKLQLSDDFQWELLVINNNCTDNTEDVINEFIDKLPLRRVFEPTPGLSNARNAAVSNAKGDFIIWTDDDVLVDSNWLVAYCEAFIKRPDVAVFGGPVIPWFEGEPPKWLIDGWQLLANAFAARDLGSETIELDATKGILPYGANYAVRMTDQKLNLYDPNLGLSGNAKILGEETQVMTSILNNGNKGLWLPDAKVKHWIPKQRQSLKYIRNYCEGSGRTTILLENSQKCKLLLGKPRWLIKKIITTYIRYLYQRAFTSNNVWIKTMVGLYTDIGSFKQFKN